MEATIWKLGLGFVPCSLDSTLLHVSASTAWGVEGSSSSRPNYQSVAFFFHWFILEYIRRSLSSSQCLMLPEGSLFRSMSIRAGLSFTNSPEQQMRETTQHLSVYNLHSPRFCSQFPCCLYLLYKFRHYLLKITSEIYYRHSRIFLSPIYSESNCVGNFWNSWKKFRLCMELVICHSRTC